MPAPRGLHMPGPLVRRVEGRQDPSRPVHRDLGTLALLDLDSRLPRGHDMPDLQVHRMQAHLDPSSKGHPALHSLCSYICFALKQCRLTLILRRVELAAHSPNQVRGLVY